MTPAEFKIAFPAFARSPDPLVQSRLTWAENRTPEDVWGIHRDQGIGWLVAHWLSLESTSTNLRKDVQQTTESLYSTPYGRERLRLSVVVASGYRVAKPS